MGQQIPLPPQFGYGYSPAPAAAPRMGMAIGALVCGLLGVVGCAPVGIVGIILGLVALRCASGDPQTYGGRGLAIGGIAAGILGLVITFTIIVPSLFRAREFAGRQVVTTQLKGLGMTLRLYHNDHHRLPPDLATLVREGACDQENLQAVLAPPPHRDCDFTYVAGLTLGTDPGDWIVIYGDPSWSKGEGANVLRLDGSAEFLKEPRFSAELQRCAREYQKKHGRPAQIVQPK